MNGKKWIHEMNAILCKLQKPLLCENTKSWHKVVFVIVIIIVKSKTEKQPLPLFWWECRAQIVNDAVLNKKKKRANKRNASRQWMNEWSERMDFLYGVLCKNNNHKSITIIELTQMLPANRKTKKKTMLNSKERLHIYGEHTSWNWDDCWEKL